MTDFLGVGVREEHVSALRSLLEFDPAAPHVYGNVTEDASAIAHTVMVYSAFAVAVHRKFSPTYSVTQVIRYVADLRIALETAASQVNPRVAESMIRAALGDKTLDDREPYGADTEAMMDVETSVLLDLVNRSRFGKAGFEEFLQEVVDYARRWLAARQVGGTGT